jgi:hypothetical protein
MPFTAAPFYGRSRAGSNTEIQIIEFHGQEDSII